MVHEGKPPSPNSKPPALFWLNAGVFCWSVLFCLGRFKAMVAYQLYPISSYHPVCPGIDGLVT